MKKRKKVDRNKEAYEENPYTEGDYAGGSYDDAAYDGTGYGEDYYGEDASGEGYDGAAYGEDVSGEDYDAEGAGSSYDDGTYDGTGYGEGYDPESAGSSYDEGNYDDTETGEPVQRKNSAKNKLLIALPFIIVILILVMILVITGEKKTEKTVLLEKEGYSVTSQEEKDPAIRITLDGSPSADSTWVMEMPENRFLEVKEAGQEKKGKAEYILTPKEDGVTEITFTRKAEARGISYEIVRVTLPVIVSSEEGKLSLAFEDDMDIRLGSMVGAADTDKPYLISNQEDGTASITLTDNKDDWYFEDPDNVVRISTLVDSDGRQSYTVTADTVSGQATTAEKEDPESLYYFEMQMVDGVETAVPVKGTPKKGSDEKLKEVPIDDGFENPYTSILDQYKGHSSKAEDGSTKTLILAISKKSNVTEFIDATVSPEGVVQLAPGKAPEGE